MESGVLYFLARQTIIDRFPHSQAMLGNVQRTLRVRLFGGATNKKGANLRLPHFQHTLESRRI